MKTTLIMLLATIAAAIGAESYRTIINVPLRIGERRIQWRVPAGASNYTWSAQCSTDAVHWVSWGGGPQSPPTNGQQFFRLKGVPK